MEYNGRNVNDFTIYINEYKLRLMKYEKSPIKAYSTHMLSTEMHVWSINAKLCFQNLFLFVIFFFLNLRYRFKATIRKDKENPFKFKVWRIFELKQTKYLGRLHKFLFHFKLKINQSFWTVHRNDSALQNALGIQLAWVSVFN